MALRKPSTVIPRRKLDRIIELTRRDGAQAAAAALGLETKTLAYLLADLPVRDGTVALVCQRLDEMPG